MGCQQGPEDFEVRWAMGVGACELPLGGPWSWQGDDSVRGYRSRARQRIEVGVSSRNGRAPAIRRSY